MTQRGMSEGKKIRKGKKWKKNKKKKEEQGRVRDLRE